MIRTYSLIIEGEGAVYGAYVPELPTIVVTGNSMEDLTARAKEAIRVYWETPIGPRAQPFGKLRSNCRSRAIVTA